MPIPSLENITPEQLNGLVRSEGLLKSLLDTNDPETRKLTLRALKKKNPNMSIPEVETEAAVAAAMESERKRNEDLENKVREQEARERVRAKRDEAVEKNWVAREEIPSLEQFMTDNEIPSYEKASKLYASSKRAEATAEAHKISSDKTMAMPDDKELWKNPTAWARKQASLAVDSLRR